MAGFRWVLFAQAAAAAVASLFLDGHCSSLVNGVWEKDGELFRHGALTMRHGSDASNGSDGNSSGWVVELAGQILARGDLTSSTWEVWCGGTRSHAPLTVTPFSEAIFEISAEHCGEWLRFSRIADLPIYFARSRASGFFLFFNCTEIAQWQIAPEIAELAEIADADCVNASSPRPGTALASCDNELTSVELTQAAVSLELCGRRFLPSGHTMSGPLYRSENLFLYFEPACDSRSPPRWVVSSAPSTSDLSNLDGDGACNYMAWAESNLTTGPPRHGWTAWCSDPNVSFQGNLQLPLDAYIEAYQLEAETCAAPSVSDVDLADLAGGDANLVRRMLIYARGPDDIGKLVKEVDAGFVASQGWPFAAFFTFLPFVLFGVCSACHCCRCFRCYSKERRTARVGKIGFFVVLGLLILGASTCAGAAAAGLRTLEEANAASSCASAQLLRAVLQGAEEFVGLQPLLQHMESLLEPSPGRSNLLERTEVLEQSAQLAEATLQLLQDALDVDRLLRATDTRPDLLHRCRWCQTLADLTAEAAAELRQFLGQSKVATRRRFEGLFSASQAVACSEAVTRAGRACQAAARFLQEAKANVRLVAFPCPDFSAGNASCDVKDLTQNADGTWTNVCSPRRTPKTCTLEEFTLYLQDFDARIAKVFAFLEHAIVSTDVAQLAPAPVRLPGSCATLALHWQHFMQALCYSSVPALRSVGWAFFWAGLTMLGAACLMYLVWRRAYDNYYRPKDNWMGGDDMPVRSAKSVASSATRSSALSF
ncbi:unnamed protein product [Effrenium voratum]|uniref:Uncharacterized protein n=1 Tax=Effrenium voratum TaxID=2562239 RepID=A0AA36JR30_9DINO|nr:unnamed protein product [Effrenium voratum]CAJ1438986.1 unnamed protein product [Effrenium voratum]